MTIKLYTGLGSGNSYKAELMLRLLAVPYEPIQISIPRNDHKNPDFLRISPFGQIPVLVDDGEVYTDSQAILCYLARAYGGEVTAWLRRVETLPGFWPMPRIPNLPHIPLVAPLVVPL